MSRIRVMTRMLVAGSGIAVLASATAAASTAPESTLAALPSPLPFVSGLDLECYATPGPALNLGITLSHLNPVLQGLGLPAHNVVIRELQQTCVPVMKNAVAPPATALPFLRHVMVPVAKNNQLPPP